MSNVKKPVCKLSQDGSMGFNLLKRVQQTLVENGMQKEATEFATAVSEQKNTSFNVIRQIANRYVEIV